MDTETLVLRAARGDLASREALARAWLGRVHAVALAVTRHAADAEDVTQEAFLRAFRRLPTLRRPAAFGPWIRRIARNAARDRLRRRREGAPLDEGAVSDASVPPPDAPLAGREAIEAWRRLPEMERLVSWLRIVEGTPFRDIAVLTGASKSAVDRTFRRALARLRKEGSRC